VNFIKKVLKPLVKVGKGKNITLDIFSANFSFLIERGNFECIPLTVAFKVL
jgi:hypothetical protein